MKRNFQLSIFDNKITFGLTRYANTHIFVVSKGSSVKNFPWIFKVDGLGGTMLFTRTNPTNIYRFCLSRMIQGGPIKNKKFQTTAISKVFYISFLY